jgi:hypothetical protein
LVLPNLTWCLLNCSRVYGYANTVIMPALAKLWSLSMESNLKDLICWQEIEQMLFEPECKTRALFQVYNVLGWTVECNIHVKASNKFAVTVSCEILGLGDHYPAVELWSFFKKFCDHALYFADLVHCHFLEICESTIRKKKVSHSFFRKRAVTEERFFPKKMWERVNPIRYMFGKYFTCIF